MKRKPNQPNVRHRHRYRNHPILPYLPFAAAAVVIAFVLSSLRGVNAPTTTNTTASPKSLQIETNDGIFLAADLTLPPGQDPVASVILIHDFSGDRHQWDPYVKNFTDSGLAVLQYDMRGFGDSRVPRVEGDRTAYLNSLVSDVPAVIEYIRNQPALSDRLINVVGLGLGANVAYVASGSSFGVARTVLVTPSPEDGLPDGAAVENFSPTDVMGLSDEAGRFNLESLMSRVGDPKQTTILPSGSGIALLDDAPTRADVLAWLKN